MGQNANKTEHSGAKKGKGAFYGRKKTAKNDSNKKRRENDKKAVDESEILDRRLLGRTKGSETEEVKVKTGQRPKGIGWVLKQAGEQTGKEYSLWQRKFKSGRIVETHKITFKQYLVEELTNRERRILTPPPAIQKLYAEIKKKYGIVKSEVFFSQLADKLNLTPDGLKRIQQLPALRALPFDDQSHDEKPMVTRRDPWSHVSQKSAQRSQRAREAGVDSW
jgi:hypothetical protein